MFDLSFIFLTRTECEQTGTTALHHAAKANSADMVVLLLSSGAGPNAMDHDGNTPLHFCQGVDLALQMVGYGARPGLKNNKKRVASSLGGKSLKQAEKKYAKLPVVDMDIEPLSEGNSQWRPDGACGAGLRAGCLFKTACLLCPLTLFCLSTFPPLYSPADASPTCDLCNSKFSMVNRRHHCRRCGLLVCAKCSGHNATQHGNSKKDSKLRVCDPCFNLLRRE